MAIKRLKIITNDGRVFNYRSSEFYGFWFRMHAPNMKSVSMRKRLFWHKFTDEEVNELNKTFLTDPETKGE